MVMFIEIYSEETGSGRCPKGDSSLTKIRALKPHIVAVCHNQSGGRIVSSMFRVDDRWVERSSIDALVGADADHQEFPDYVEVECRGLEMQPGTPQNKEVQQLEESLKSGIGMDLTNYYEPVTGKKWTSYLKNDTKSVGNGKWLCEHPGHNKPERNPLSKVQCSLGHVQTNPYATKNRFSFDVTKWL